MMTVKNVVDSKPNFVGPSAQGPTTARFVYIDIGRLAGQPGSVWERRIKVPLEGITSEMIEKAVSNPKVIFEAQLPGTGKDGGAKLCYRCSSKRLEVLQASKVAMPRKKSTNSDLTQQSVALAEFGAKALVTAEQLAIKKKVVDGFSLDEAERTIAAELPGLSATIKKKLGKKDGKFTVTDIACIVMSLAESLIEGEPLKRLKLLCISKKLTDCLIENVAPVVSVKPKAKARKSKPTKFLYQFKITLLGIKPTIWRRIQVQDCTLDKLHEHIQAAMGWTNSHLHQFDINGECYGDPEILDDGFDDFKCIDSTKINLSQVLPKTGERSAFKYEYDFGDSWEHEILFEGNPKVDPKAKYPICLEGERACPPEDCGGVWGYDDFLEAISNPNHEEHESMLEWIGGKFDSEKFDSAKATKEMRRMKP